MYHGRCVCDDACSVRGSGSNLAAGTQKYLQLIYIHCTCITSVYSCNSRSSNICFLIIGSNKGLSDVLFILYTTVYQITNCWRHLLQKLSSGVGSHEHYQGSSIGFVVHHYAGKVRKLLTPTPPQDF